MKLIIDGNLLASRAMHGTGAPLCTSSGRMSAVAFTFLRSLSWNLKQQSVGWWNVIVVWDGGHSDYRKKLLPGYKVHDPDPKADAAQDEIDRLAFRDQCKELHEQFLPSLGMRSVKFPYCEADDVIAAHAHQIAGSHAHQVYLLSGDKDFHQLVCDSIYVIDSKGKTITEADVLERWGGTGHIVPLVRALIGDKSDEIDGVPGIGEKRAKLLAPYIEQIIAGNINLEGLGLKPTDVKWAKVAFEHRDLIERNRKLMELPTSFTHPALTTEKLGLQQRDKLFAQLHTRPERDIHRFLELCREWEFHFTNETLSTL